MGFKNIDISSHIKTVLGKLIDEKIDLAVAIDMELYGKKYADLNMSLIEDTGVVLYETNLCIAFNKNFSDTEVARWQSELQKLHDSGEYELIYEKYMR